MVGPLAATRVGVLDGAQIKPLDRLDRKACQIALRKLIPHVRRHQHGRITIGPHEVAAHRLNYGAAQA
jgi:hypothetical protein